MPQTATLVPFVSYFLTLPRLTFLPKKEKTSGGGGVCPDFNWVKTDPEFFQTKTCCTYLSWTDGKENNKTI